MIIDELPQDRIVDELYAWVIVDPKTSLESIFGFMIGNAPMQAVTSSRATALLIMSEVVRQHINESGKKVKLVRFKKVEESGTVTGDLV